MAGISALMGEIFGLKTTSLIENSYESVLPILDKLPYFFLFSPFYCHVMSELIIRDRHYSITWVGFGLLSFCSGDHRPQFHCLCSIPNTVKTMK